MDTSSNDNYDSPTDAELEKMVKQMLDDIFGGDITDSETGDDPNWTADKAQRDANFDKEDL